MIKIAVQVDSLKSLKEATKSKCDRIRFGAEFCEWKIPKRHHLEEAYISTKESGKDFVYVTPRISNTNVENIENHLKFLNERGKTLVVINDFGVLNIIKKFPNLKPHLGRQMVYIPSRCPWEQITEEETGFLKKRRVKKNFYQTSLNYDLSIRFFKKLGVLGADFDWLPNCTPHLKSIAEKGFDVSFHINSTPIAITGKCHTARYLGVKNLDECGKQCLERAFLLKHDILDIQLVLCGNAVFKSRKLSREDLKQLKTFKDAELVMSMNPATGIESQKEIKDLADRLRF